MSLERGDDGEYVNLEEGSKRHEQQKEGEREQDQQQQLAPLDSIQSSPWLVWPVFVLSNLAGGTAGPVMVLMQNVNPISMVGWRHQISSLVMLPGFIYESVKMDPSKRRKFWSRPSLLLHLLSSLALVGHYSTYSLALYRTSMPHCLFLMNTSPVYVALFVKFSGGVLHPFELGGIVLSLLGIGVFAVGNAVESSSSGSGSHVGDFLAILSAVFTAIYLVVGKSLRRWMPLFVYQFPVAVICMIVLGLGGWISKGWTTSGADVASGPFGWLNKEYWWETIYLGVVPGVFGHAGYSYVLRYSAPLVMPTGLTLQPIVGSFLSWLLGQTQVPGAWTWIGGVAILGGTTLVNFATTLKQKKFAESSAEQSSSTVDDQGQSRKPLLHNRS